MIAVLVVWLGVIPFAVLVVWGVWCSVAPAVRARRRQARFDRARDTQGTGTL